MDGTLVPRTVKMQFCRKDIRVTNGRNDRASAVAPNLAAVLSLGVMVFGGCHAPTSKLPRPLTVAERDELDRLTLHQAGRVLAGTPIRHSFRFRNRTESDLQLSMPDGVP